jgi:hypothetical protein
MIPHERSLVEELKNKPFALLGINTDGQAEYQKGLKAEPVTWRSFDDGNTSGPICETWNIDSFPSIFVLDHEGVIRYRDVRGDDLEAAVKELVAKAEAAASKK